MNKLTILLVVALFALLSTGNAQEIDLLIKNGHLIDPRNEIDGPMDVAIKDGKILEIAGDISADRAGTVVDATGLYVTPGLIDIHVHNFHGTEPNAMYSNGWNSVAPDGFTFRSGVTTVVDQGCAGWRNFATFKENVIDKSKTRVLAFVNIVGSGMKGGAVEQNKADMDPKLAAMAVKQYPETIVGVKVAHYVGPEWEPVENAVKAGELANVPVMVDFGSSQPVLSLETLLLEKLRPGDIFTHCYGATRGRGHVVDDSGNLNSFALRAQEKGIIFDVGHGGGSFTFKQGVNAVKQGLKPNSISTDLHIGSMNGGMKDQLNVMSKFLNMGMNMQEVIETSTWNPAQIIKRNDLGHLSVGAEADLVVLDLMEGEFGFIDVDGYRMDGTRKLECELTVKGGQVMWDLNGISRPLWTEQ